MLLLVVIVNTTVTAPTSTSSKGPNDSAAVSTNPQITNASNISLRTAALPETEARFTAEELIKDAIQLRNIQVVTSESVVKPARSSAQIFGADHHAKADDEYSRLREKKRLLATHDLVFNGVTSKVDLVSFTQNANVATAEVSEVTELTYANYADGTTPPPSGYSYPQVAQLTEGASGWEIVSLDPKTPGGIPPTTVQRGPVRTEPAKQSLPATVPNSAQKPAMTSPSGVGMLTNKSVGNSGPAKAFKGSAQKPGTLGIMTTASYNTNLVSSTSYNYQAMMDYAWNWAYGRNPNYPSYDADCTNFVSQAMEAGGWGEVGGWYQSDSSWWHNWVYNASWPWSGAQNFANFANGAGRISYLPYLSWMGAADIMQIAEEAPNNQNVTHTTIVTFVNGDDIRVSYHTEDHRDRSIWDIYYGSPSSWVYYALRT